MFPTYDPNREEVKGYVRDLKARRNKRAAELRFERNRCRKILSSCESASWNKADLVRLVNSCARRNAKDAHYTRQRSDNKSLRAYAMQRWHYAESNSGYGAYDTEYYSACGYDDYVGELKSYARSVALEIWRTIGRFD